jgi:transcription elongation factor GreB
VLIRYAAGITLAMPNYLTPAGAKELADELNRLVSLERPRVVTEVSDADDHGVRSENAEYTYGKKRLREIDRRIRFITKRLDGAVVVRKEDSAARDDVRFGALVEVVDENGKVSAYRIVGPDEADPSSGRISFQSPLGKSLMKRRVGDAVTVQRPAGEIELEVRSIRYD